MKTRYPISECIISSRNILMSGRSNENVLDCLTNALQDIDSILVGSTREIVKFCVQETISEIGRSNFIGAGLILNLIHNLPLDDASKQCWDIDYFLSMELLTFLEHFDEIVSSRKIVFCVCGQLAAQYGGV